MVCSIDSAVNNDSCDKTAKSKSHEYGYSSVAQREGPSQGLRQISDDGTPTWRITITDEHTAKDCEHCAWHRTKEYILPLHDLLSIRGASLTVHSAHKNNAQEVDDNAEQNDGYKHNP